MIKVALADPEGSALFSYYRDGELKSDGNSISEGIGQGRITANLAEAPIDMAFRLSDHDALPLIFDLMRMKGFILVGLPQSTLLAQSKWPVRWDPATQS